MTSTWDADYDAEVTGRAGPSFIDRARNALPDDDDIPMPGADNNLAFLQQDSDETPLEQLTRHWMNERHAPDILPSQDLLLANILDHIRRQVRLYWAG